MLIAAAVVPHPPVLVPEVAQGFSPDLDALRSACRTAVDRLYAAGADEVLIVGAGPEQGGEVVPRGSFRAYGVNLDVDGRWGPGAFSGSDSDSDSDSSLSPSPADSGAVPMTLPFLIAAWLLRDRPAEPVRRVLMVDERGGAAVPAVPAIGGARQAMLVLGDGSASRTPQAPGHFDERAEPYDALVARALATADTGTLAGLDPDLSRELHVAGLPAWRVLADAAAASGAEYDADLLYDEAPYGVGYFVATWLAR